jgi:hypothetical protein
MKTIIRTTTFIAAILFSNFISAQSNPGTVAMNNPETEKKTEEVKSDVPVKAKEITLDLKNSCERKVLVFAGPKTDLFSGKGQYIGGVSTSKMFTVEGDVICIMNDPKTIQACSIVKEGLTKVTVNSSGNGFIK